MIYAHFNDSQSDPTFAAANQVLLLETTRKDLENPCTDPLAISVSVMPQTAEEIRIYADFLGWYVRVENGKLVIDSSKKYRILFFMGSEAPHWLN